MDDLTVRTPKQIANGLNKSVSWVYANARELGAVKIGGSWIFTAEGVKDAIQGQKEKQVGRGP